MEKTVFLLSPLTTLTFLCETPLLGSSGSKCVMSRHYHHFRSRANTLEQRNFLVDAGKLEAGL
jgi:hypothetical protein